MRCKKCNAELPEGSKQCNWCGSYVDDDISTNMKKNKINEGHKKLWIALGVVGIAVVLVILAVMSPHGEKDNNGSKVVSDSHLNTSITPKNISPTSFPKSATSATPEPVKTTVSHNLFYFKDNTLYCMKSDGLNVKPVVSNVKDFGEFYGSLMMDKGEKQLLYLDGKEDKKSLFNCNLTLLNKQYKVDTNISEYKINADGTKVYYLKNENLYRSDLSNCDKIEDGVNDYYSSEDGNSVVYTTLDGFLMLKKNKQSSQQIAMNSRIVYVSPDLNIIYYLEEDALYLLHNDKEKKLIAKGVSNVIQIYEGGQIYYTCGEFKTLADYIDDDMATADSVMKSPNRKDFSNQDSYKKANLKYIEKVNRDEQREVFDQQIAITSSLYYYDKGKSTKIASNCTDCWAVQERNYKTVAPFQYNYGGSNEPRIVYSCVKVQNSKVKMSQVPDNEEVYNYLLQTLDKEVNEFICERAKNVHQLASEKLYNLYYDGASKKIFYYKLKNQKDDNGELFNININDTKNIVEKLCAKNVSVNNKLILGKDVIYIKNMDKTKKMGDLFINNKMVDQNVIGVGTIKLTGSDSIIYSTDLTKDGTFTLKIYKHGKIYIIAKNVMRFKAFDENNIAYIEKVTKADSLGDLYFDNGVERKLIARQVLDIVEPMVSGN